MSSALAALAPHHSGRNYGDRQQYRGIEKPLNRVAAERRDGR